MSKNWIIVVVGVLSFLGLTHYAVASEMSISVERAFERAMQRQENRWMNEDQEVQRESVSDANQGVDSDVKFERVTGMESWQTSPQS